MFNQVRHAILPLALRRAQAGDELERAVLLIESLSRHWLDREPLELLIISPQRDLELIEMRLARYGNIAISVHGERDFFPRFSRFYAMPGWYRQQLVKLLVPAVLGIGGYLTLDSDVFCVDDFGSTTFVKDGRALSRWEPKSHHDWWQQTARFVGVPHDVSAHGLSVTPNVLHSDLAHQAINHVGCGLFDWQTALALRLVRKIGRVPWTEYALYSCVAELTGNLFEYHVHWDDCYCRDSQVLSEHSSIWHARDFDRRAHLARRNPRAKFIVVQSKANLPIERVREYCLILDSGAQGWQTEVVSQ